ncbi:MAG: type II CAAX endopeptidase family protein [bacterium]|nr:type II CAAX endopeptidase family protein [bacterium]
MGTTQNFLVAIVIPLLIFGIVCIKKTKKGEFVRWSCKDILIILILVDLTRIALPFIEKIFKNTLIHYFGIFELFLIYLIYKLILQKYSFKFSNIGLKKENFSKNLNLGLRISLLYFMIILFALVILGKGFLEIPGVFYSNQLFLRFLEKPIVIFFIIFSSAVLAPLAEELFSLGVIYPILKTKIGADGAILVSGIIFSSMHGIFLFSLIVEGIIKATLYEKTNSLIPSIIVHSLSNVSLILMAFFSGGIIICSQRKIIISFLLITGILFIILQLIANRNKKLEYKTIK